MRESETADILYRLFHWYPSGVWMGWVMFRRRFWGHPYLYQDNIGRRFHRWIWCRHRDRSTLINKGVYCYDCERWINDVWEDLSANNFPHDLGM